MRGWLFATPLVAVALLGCAQPATASDPAACTPAAATAFARTLLAKTVAGKAEPGVTLAIYAPTRFSRPVAIASGYADYARKTPMKPDSRLLAGSVGKTFFGAAALKLAEDGKLNLDRPIAQLLPALDIPAGDKVTTRMLLAHTSGYGEYDGDFMQDLIKEPLRTRTMADWLGPIRRNPPGPLGTFRYSDINYVILAEVISAAAGEPWDRYIARTFLKPFGLRDTIAAKSPTVPGLVPSYAGPTNFFGRDAMVQGKALIYNPQFESGGGGYASTAPDLARWIVRLGTANAYSPATLKLATTPIIPPDDKGKSRGLGIHIDKTPVGTAYGHSGYIPGYVSWVRYYEKPAIGIAMMTNTSDEARFAWDGYDVMDELAAELVRRCG